MSGEKRKIENRKEKKKEKKKIKVKSKESEKELKPLSLEEKYRLYEKSVQNHTVDIDFMNREYFRIRKHKPLSLREDFCGTAAMACDWVKQSEEHLAFGVDLDDEPIGYGQKVHYAPLTSSQQSRMHYVQGNVLEEQRFATDITCAFNFSYFIFKQRAVLLKYFKMVLTSLKEDGMFFLDIFGGTSCNQELEEETEHPHHSYFWDCDSFNPLTSEVLYYIHFRVGKKKYKKVFTYDWRMWTIAEIKEMLEEAGFQKVVTYWEGTEEDGTGDGEFYPSEKEKNCESWVTYIMAIK